MKQGKREHSRVEVSWPVTLLTDKQSIVGEIKNISESGAMIGCQDLPSPEEKLKLKIEITDIFHVSATVENVRFTVDDSSRDPTAYYLAVRFTEITEDERKILYNAIDQEVRKRKH